MAPGHRPNLLAGDNQEAIDKVKKFIADGQPNERVDIRDVNQGREKTGPTRRASPSTGSTPTRTR
ncbi:MAG: hypothetical protein VW268_05635 [Rhodospirillaceae bacterium]